MRYKNPGSYTSGFGVGHPGKRHLGLAVSASTQRHAPQPGPADDDGAAPSLQGFGPGTSWMLGGLTKWAYGAGMEDTTWA